MVYSTMTDAEPLSPILSRGLILPWRKRVS
jgi:hypothetical protein